MLQKESNLFSCDKSGVQLIKIFHLYGGFNRKFSFLGDFVKVSVKIAKTNSQLKKKNKIKCLIVRTRFLIKKNDNSFVLFFNNSGVLLKKRTTSFGKRIVGPTMKLIKRKKLINSFSKII